MDQSRVEGGVLGQIPSVAGKRIITRCVVFGLNVMAVDWKISGYH